MGSLETRPGITPTFRESAGAEPSTPSRPEPAFDPKNPFGSLTAGGHQFTILWDTDHGDPSIPGTVAENIAAMAASGVKHVMLEYSGTPESRDLLDRFYRTPPQATELDMILNSEFFESTYGQTPLDIEQSGLSYVAMMIEARRHGIKVHLAGDEAGYALAWEMDSVEEEKRAYLAENAVIHRIYEHNLKDSALLESLAPDDRDRLMKELLAQGERLSDFTDRWLEINDRYVQERLGVEAQIARADRFIDLAQGEKAVVLWGQNHHGKLDVALDHRLRQEALKDGALEQMEPTRSMDMLSSRAKAEALKARGTDLLAPARYFVAEKEAEGFNEQEKPRTSPAPAGLKPVYTP